MMIVKPVKTREAAIGRERLLQEAERLFATRGYNAVSIRDIAEATGLSHGAIYHHFVGKEALFCALIEQTAAHMAATLRNADKSLIGQPTRVRIRRLCELYWEFGRAKLEIVEQMLNNLAALNSEQVRATIPRFRQMVVGVLEEALRDGVARGEVRPEIDISLATLALFRLLNVVFSTLLPNELAIDGGLDFILTLFFDGIGQPD
jgi:AcrR family transcriptional regulator